MRNHTNELKAEKSATKNRGQFRAVIMNSPRTVTDSCGQLWTVSYPWRTIADSEVATRSAEKIK